jgi:HAMP domain-containing protein
VFGRSIAGHVIAIVELLEATPPAARPGLLEALNSPLLQVEIARDRPLVTGRMPWHAARFRRIIVERLHALGNRPIDVEVVFRRWRAPPGPGPGPHHGGRMRRLMPSPEKIAISVGQSDGTWLLFTVASGIRWRPWGVRIVFWIGLAAVVILLTSMWAAHRVTRPLARFAEAADRLGVDVRAPPLPETGSRELRQATSAFNRMQERLRRLIDDRTLMLAAISHDLRTALTRLKLRTEFIDDAPSSSTTPSSRGRRSTISTRCRRCSTRPCRLPATTRQPSRGPRPTSPAWCRACATTWPTPGSRSPMTARRTPRSTVARWRCAGRSPT